MYICLLNARTTLKVTCIANTNNFLNEISIIMLLVINKKAHQDGRKQHRLSKVKDNTNKLDIRQVSIRLNEHLSKHNNSVFGHSLKFNKHYLSANDNLKLLHYITSRNILILDLYVELEISKEMSDNSYCLNNHSNFHKNFSLYKISVRTNIFIFEL